MNELPLVDVVVPCYNHAAFVKDCIDSVLAQSYPNIRLLVIDDGSKDESPQILREMATKYGFNLRVQTNKGLLPTLNDALHEVNGEYFAPFASDDIMLPDRIALQMAHMQAHPEVAICGGNIIPIDDSGRVLEKKRRRRPARRLDFDSIFNNLLPGAPAPSFLMRRDVVIEVGGYDTDLRIEDLTMMLKVCSAGYVVDVLEEELAYYRTHAQNTHANIRFMLDEVLKIYALFADHKDYEKVCLDHRKSVFLKAAKLDKPLAREIIKQIPLRSWDMKTLRGATRLYLQ
ncbi:MAG: glycosyl transferase [Oceanobacter sp.]|nr:MAG: glycosyl transferase [Oceanobacter sp.]